MKSGSYLKFYNNSAFYQRHSKQKKLKIMKKMNVTIMN